MNHHFDSFGAEGDCYFISNFIYLMAESFSCQVFPVRNVDIQESSNQMEVVSAEFADDIGFFAPAAKNSFHVYASPIHDLDCLERLKLVEKSFEPTELSMKRQL